MHDPRLVMRVSVGAAKISTGSGRDTWLMTDAGSQLTLDFTHAGYPSTYLLSAEQIDQIIEILITNLSAANIDAIVVEVADGLLQRETAALLNSKVFAKNIDSLILRRACHGAVAGAPLLEQKNYHSQRSVAGPHRRGDL